MNKRFCAECGAALQLNPSPLPRASLPPRMTIARTQHPFLVGRDRDLESADALRRSAEGCFVALNVVGEAGVGRTRLLAELAAGFGRGNPDVHGVIIRHVRDLRFPTGSEAYLPADDSVGYGLGVASAPGGVGGP